MISAKRKATRFAARSAWLGLFGLSLSSFALLTCGGDESVPCEVGTQLACETGNGQPGGASCESSGKYSEDCTPAKAKCDPDECSESGLCRTAPVVTLADDAWNYALVEWKNGLGLFASEGEILNHSLTFRLLDPSGFQQRDAIREIASTKYNLNFPAVLWDRDRFLLTWELWASAFRVETSVAVLDADLKEIGRQNYPDGETVHAAAVDRGYDLLYYDRIEEELSFLVQRFERDGTEVGGPRAFRFSNHPIIDAYDHVWTGTHHAVFFATNGSVPDTRLAQWDSEGNLVREPVVVAEGGANDGSDVTLAWNGKSLGMLWNQGEDVLFAEAEPDGEVSAVQVVSTGGGIAKTLAATPNGWVASWSHGSEEGTIIRLIDEVEDRWQPIRLGGRDGFQSYHSQVIARSDDLVASWSLSANPPVEERRIEMQTLKLCE